MHESNSEQHDAAGVDKLTSAYRCLDAESGRPADGPTADCLVRFSFGQLRPRRTEMGYARYNAAARGAQTGMRERQLGPNALFEAHLGNSLLPGSGRAVRDRALFDLASDYKLRRCHLFKIKTVDLVTGPKIRTPATVVQRKTGHLAQFELASDLRSSLLAWLESRGEPSMTTLFQVVLITPIT